ncbi:MAG: GNAT family N-acetyltransferase [Chloroflexota bacterium]
MASTDFELIQMQVEALFVHDSSSRLLRINEPDPPDPAPRFFLGRTQAGNLWRTRYNLPPDLAAELARLAADEPVAADFRAPPRHEAEYLQLLEQHAPPVTRYSGPAYSLPQLDAPARAVTITAENAPLLEAHFAWLRTTFAEYAPVVAVVADGVAVSVCFSSRLTARAAAAGVDTEANYRGRGYAPDAVRGWAAAVRASGRLPLYDTSWANSASQAVARKLGAVQYGTDYSLT